MYIPIYLIPGTIDVQQQCIVHFKKLTNFLSVSLSLSPLSFRRQYEQLQAVIVRVLRPAATTSGSGGQQVGGAATPTEQGDAGLETDDMSAVREVRLAYENVKVVDCLDLTPEGNAAWEAALKRYSIVTLPFGTGLSWLELPEQALDGICLDLGLV